MFGADTDSRSHGRPAPPPPARTLESVLIGAALAARRLPWTDAPARALGLDVLTRDGLTRLLLAQVRRGRSTRPVRIRTPFGAFLTPMSVECAASLLAAGQEAGALAAPVGFTEAGHRYWLPPHTDLPSAVGELRESASAVIANETDKAMDARCADGTVDWQEWCQIMRRLSRRLVIGEAAADDTLLSEAVAAAAAADGAHEQRTRADAVGRRLELYLDASDVTGVSDPQYSQSPNGSQGSRGSQHPHILPAQASAEASGQATPVSAFSATLSLDQTPAAVQHTLSLVTETLTTTVLQALALYALQEPGTIRAQDAVEEALRRYPLVPAPLYAVAKPFRWDGMAISAGTEILCASAWLLDLEGWDRPNDGLPSPLCAAIGGCAATDLATRAAIEVVAAIVGVVRPVVRSPRADPAHLPHSLPADSLIVAFADPESFDIDGTAGAGASAVAGRVTRGARPAQYAALAGEAASRLERQAGELAACAENEGWNNDAVGEHFRMVLLNHAQRCAAAGKDVRRAAERLSG